MRSDLRLVGATLDAGSQLDYRWRSGWPFRRRWNRMAARAAAAPRLPLPGSLAEFIVDHYWAYVRGRDGNTGEYRVVHRPWRVAGAESVVWDCDLARAYGDSPLARYLAGPPVSAFVADGSPVQVFRGKRLKSAIPPTATTNSPVGKASTMNESRARVTGPMRQRS
jgi:uncharacterized protein